MSETLSVRLPDGEKRRLRAAARHVGESLAEYVRKAALNRASNAREDDWGRHFGTADSELPPTPRNTEIRRAMRRE